MVDLPHIRQCWQEKHFCKNIEKIFSYKWCSLALKKQNSQLHIWLILHTLSYYGKWNFFCKNVWNCFLFVHIMFLGFKVTESAFSHMVDFLHVLQCWQEKLFFKNWRKNFVYKLCSLALKKHKFDSTCTELSKQEKIFFQKCFKFFPFHTNYIPCLWRTRIRIWTHIQCNFVQRNFWYKNVQHFFLFTQIIFLDSKGRARSIHA